ncbi:migration and invasion-inhibitory protein [Brachionichthys hirsutus]|uniref:migration and invasion-inhibitory protein n=1 Tax=Brachionichthys hirsutus TaxID=412623 RepID=UPI003604E305
MSSTDELNVLRERNKELLKQLKQLSGCRQRHKRGREDDPEEILIRTDAEPGTAGAALAKPTVRFAVHASTMATPPPPSLTSKHGEGSAAGRSSDGERHLQDQGVRAASTKSRLLNHSEEQGESQRGDAVSHRLQPLLGYDWIAGILEADDSTIERPDEFFNELSAFRSLNRVECHHSPRAAFSESNHSGLPSLMDKDDPEATVDTHKCTFSYRINGRLFPVPLRSQESCPVCKRQKSFHPHTVTEPAPVRVSIPRAALGPPFKYRAHRRCSFDPSDSLGLPSHCLSGWSNTGPGALPPLSSLDLRSNLNRKTSSGLQDTELEVMLPGLVP